MNIQINEKTRLTSDSHNFIIQKLTGKDKDTGDDIWTAKKFYTTLDGLFRGLHIMNLLASDAESLQELAEDVKESNRQLESLSKELACIEPTGGVM